MIKDACLSINHVAGMKRTAALHDCALESLCYSYVTNRPQASFSNRTSNLNTNCFHTASVRNISANTDYSVKSHSTHAAIYLIHIFNPLNGYAVISKTDNTFTCCNDMSPFRVESGVTSRANAVLLTGASCDKPAGNCVSVFSHRCLFHPYKLLPLSYFLHYRKLSQIYA